MKYFDKNKLPFDKYKNCLIPYLQHMGVDISHPGLIRCFHPQHDDKNPSCSVNENLFHCYVCGDKCSGDIYDAVEILTGETDKAKQFQEIDRIFGNGEAASLQAIEKAPVKEIEKKDFVPNLEALQKFTEWLKNFPHYQEYVRSWFSKRATVSTGGKIKQYPGEILNKLVTYFLWFPGKSAALNALGSQLLLAAGVAYKKENGKIEDYPSITQFPAIGKDGQIYVDLTKDTCYFWNGGNYEQFKEDPRKIAWWSDGVVTITPNGYKLFYYAYDEEAKREKSNKSNPRSVPFLFADELPKYEGKSIILVEGEMDALVCRACGIQNIFSIGGLNNFSKPKIRKLLIPANISEVIFFADKDPEDHKPPFQSQKMFGLIPPTPDDGIKETLPEKLIAEGFTGTIKTTVLPDNFNYKDPDEAILNGHLDLVLDAINNAKKYTPREKPQPGTKMKTAAAAPKTDIICPEWEPIPIKFFRSFLKKIPYDELSQEDKDKFIPAALLSCKDLEASQAISEWTKAELSLEDLADIRAKNKDCLKDVDKISNHPLYHIAVKHGASKYLLDRLEEILVPAAEILNMISPIPTVFPVDYEKLIETKNFKTFLHYCDHAFGSYTVAEALKNRLLYINTEEANYVFIENRWVFIPSIATESHSILLNALLCYLRKNPKDKKLVTNAIEKIGTTPFRRHLAFDLNHKEAQFYHDENKDPVLFDSQKIAETITLEDGVMDFSGDKIKFRKGTPEEFRLTYLPYTCKQIRNAANPEFFLKALDMDFDTPDEETLKQNPTLTKDTLLYYLSLLPSRNISKSYSCFMTGPGGTGKSTLLKSLEGIFTNNCFANLKASILIANKRSYDNDNGPTPELAELEGKMFSVTMELPEDGRLNSDQLKRLTGNDMISARKLRQGLHKFLPTAQVIIVGNELPSFYKHDSGIIRRLLVFHFNVEHLKRSKDAKYKELYKSVPSNPNELERQIISEAPGIIKLLAEKYIELKEKYNLNIPTSQECENAKSSYIAAQSKDTDEFYEACIKFTPNDSKSFIFSTDLYKCYLNFKGYQPGSAEALNQRRFIFYLKKDHHELQGDKINVQQRRPGALMPEWGFRFISFTEKGLEFLNSNQPPQQQTLIQEQQQEQSPEPEDNPFDGFDSTSNQVNHAEPDDQDDGSNLDIF